MQVTSWPKPIGCKWVFKQKYNANDSKVRKNARLTAGEDQQVSDDHSLVTSSYVLVDLSAGEHASYVLITKVPSLFPGIPAGMNETSISGSNSFERRYNQAKSFSVIVQRQR